MTVPDSKNLRCYLREFLDPYSKCNPEDAIDVKEEMMDFFKILEKLRSPWRDRSWLSSFPAERSASEGTGQGATDGREYG